MSCLNRTRRKRHDWNYLMKILVDADAFPNVIKDIMFRAAGRHRIPMILFANQQVNIKKSPYISCIAVPAGPDVADDRIVELVQHGDLVITADIPLADRVVARGAYAINPRGPAVRRRSAEKTVRHSPISWIVF